ncbi:MAG: hypothetical protein VB031_01315 [Eubacteriaceae bacterium]|nr:hypothetical protein [Eubacteriaceae bacterium]
MKHKWKIFTATIAVMMIMALAGCGSSDGNSEKTLADSANVPGDTITTMKKSDSDNKLHKVTYEITDIISGTDKVNKIINKYNSSGKSTTIGEISGDNVKYCVAKYKVKYPKDFPAKEYGITDPALDFKITNEDGGSTIKFEDTEYKELSETWEIGNEPMGYDFYPGDTYKGMIVYMMARGCKEYLIEEYYKDGDTTEKNYIEPD